MPAPIVVVHSDRRQREAVLAALRSAGLEVAAFDDPVAALDAIEKDSRARVLVSRIDFGQGKLNGVALVRMLRHKQIMQDGKSALRAVFIGRRQNGHHALLEGDFVPVPIDLQALVGAVGKALAEG